MTAATQKPTGAPPKIINGVTFRCYRTGIMSREWQSECLRLAVHSTYNNTAYLARVDGEYITGRNPAKTKRFRTLEAAMITAALRLQLCQPNSTK